MVAGDVIKQTEQRKLGNDVFVIYHRIVVFEKKDGRPSEELRQIQVQKKDSFGESKSYPRQWNTLGLAKDFGFEEAKIIAKVINGEEGIVTKK